jgi:hypothetical protein
VNVNPTVIAALASLSLPVCPNVYTGIETDYITFNYTDERPALNADDEDIYDSTTIDVHYYTKSNPQQTKKAIRRLMRLAGFSIVSTQELYESDTNYTHVIVTCCIGGDVDD